MRIKNIILFIITFSLFAFQQKSNNSIKGIWTDKSTQNATFIIKDKTIYYIEDTTIYKYTFKNGVIKIYFTDYTFTGRVYFEKSGMVIKSSDGNINKYWHFKG